MYTYKNNNDILFTSDYFPIEVSKASFLNISGAFVLKANAEMPVNTESA